MKAKELMIGDWVQYPYGIRKVTELDSFLDRVCSEDFSVGEVDAIPLTPEILEKNGFEVQDQGGGRKDLWTGFGIDCEGDIEIEFQDNIPIHLKIDGAFKGEYYTSSNITYTHQLQHALRLCGIGKEITL